MGPPHAGSDLFQLRHGAGPMMLVMHGGLGWDHAYLRSWLDPLGEEFKLVYYDHAGNGRSPEPNWDEVTHETRVDGADTLREASGEERIFVLGHSYGAFLAMEYAPR